MVAGGGYKALCFIKRLLPDRLISWILYRMYCTNKRLSSDVWDFEKGRAGPLGVERAKSL